MQIGQFYYKCKLVYTCTNMIFITDQKLFFINIKKNVLITINAYIMYTKFRSRVRQT